MDRAVTQTAPTRGALSEAQWTAGTSRGMLLTAVAAIYRCLPGRPSVCLLADDSASLACCPLQPSVPGTRPQGLWPGAPEPAWRRGKPVNDGPFCQVSVFSESSRCLLQFWNILYSVARFCFLQFFTQEHGMFSWSELLLFFRVPHPLRFEPHCAVGNEAKKTTKGSLS